MTNQPAIQLALFELELTDTHVGKEGNIYKSYKGALQHLWKVYWDNKLIHVAMGLVALTVTIGMCYWVTAIEEVSYRNATRRCWMEERRGNVSAQKRIPCPPKDRENFIIETIDDGGE